MLKSTFTLCYFLKILYRQVCVSGRGSRLYFVGCIGLVCRSVGGLDRVKVNGPTANSAGNVSDEHIRSRQMETSGCVWLFRSVLEYCQKELEGQ